MTREDIIKEGTRCIKEEVTLAEKITSEELTGNQKKADELRKEYIERATQWGMTAIGITDGGSVQAFPEAYKMKPKIKVLYGMEAYLVADDEASIFGNTDRNIDDTTFCVLDLETTGKSYRTGKITEIGIMKVKIGSEIVQNFLHLFMYMVILA